MKLRNSVKQSVKVAQESQSDFANVLLKGMKSSEMILMLSRNLNSDYAHVFVWYLDQITNSFVAGTLLSLLGLS